MNEDSGDGDSAKTKSTEYASNDELLRLSSLSSSSTAFNSWTILPAAERVEILDNTSGSEDAVGDQQKIVDKDHKHANDRCSKPMEDPQADDISDGISIISDCESTDRLTPHPFLRDHLSELNFNELHTPIILNSGDPDVSASQEFKQLRQRPHRSEPDETVEASVLRASTEPKDNRLMPSPLGDYRLPTLVQNGLTAVFYVGATLAILAFIGKLRHPEWGQGEGDKTLAADLERRVGDLELQNNLMRAEIDIMSRQLQYLSSGQGQAEQRPDAARKGKTFKAWTGNGNSVDPVDITKEDLKRPYKCPDGKYVEIAAMCMENQRSMPPHAESLADEIGNVVNDVLQQSQTFQNFEKVTERLAGTLKGTDELPPPAKPRRAEEINNSKERYKTKLKHRHSQEKRGDDSKERHKRKYDHSRERDSGSGEWHERMMEHRANSRHKHEQKQRQNKNWYIERGNSREQRRSGEMGR